jgi:hypothetical protein
MLQDRPADAPRTGPAPRRRPVGGRLPSGGVAWPWIAVGVAVVGLAVLFVALVRVRPAYDAYGWLVWGRQAVRLRLDTSAAPSWKPLTFLFTFPYALVFGRAALWVWMVTAVAAGFAAPVFAGRIAYRLAGPDGTAGGHRYARVTAAVLAGAGVLGIEGYWHLLLIATADPMMVALCLAAIDCTLSGRLRAGWVLLVLACLGRPEASPLVVVFAVWAWRGRRVSRPLLVAGVSAVPLLWFGIPALTSYSWLIAGDVLDESTKAITGNKVVAILQSFTGLYELPMQLAGLLALVVAVLLRERTWLLMVAAAVVWLAVDVALAVHGSGIAPRYLFEPAAVVIVLAAAALGRLLALEPHRVPFVRWAALAAIAGLVVSLASPARLRARLAHNGIVLGRTWAKQLDRLHLVIAREGGPQRILACGEAVTTVSYQSILAWELDRNVIEIGWRPVPAIRRGRPIVLFAPVGAGWHVRAIHAAPRCRHLDAATPTSR